MYCIIMNAKALTLILLTLLIYAPLTLTRFTYTLPKCHSNSLYYVPSVSNCEYAAAKLPTFDFLISSIEPWPFRWPYLDFNLCYIYIRIAPHQIPHSGNVISHKFLREAVEEIIRECFGEENYGRGKSLGSASLPSKDMGVWFDVLVAGHRRFHFEPDFMEESEWPRLV
jgi:hypothetical protein